METHLGGPLDVALSLGAAQDCPGTHPGLGTLKLHKANFYGACFYNTLERKEARVPSLFF